MKIGIDLDNVLNNLNQEWIKLYNNDYDDNLAIEDIKDWNLHKYVKCGKEIYDYLTSSLFNKLKPLPHSVEVTQRLSEKYELFVVTATSPEHLDVKAKWLKKYFPHIPEENLISTTKKYLVNVSILIDDAPHNIESFPNATIVLDYAWNRDLQVSNKHTNWRVYNWLEIEEVIKKLIFTCQ